MEEIGNDFSLGTVELSTNQDNQTNPIGNIPQDFQQLVDKVLAIQNIIEINLKEQKMSTKTPKIPKTDFNILDLFKPEEILAEVLKKGT